MNAQEWSAINTYLYSATFYWKLLENIHEIKMTNLNLDFDKHYTSEPKLSVSDLDILIKFPSFISPNLTLPTDIYNTYIHALYL